MEQSLVIDKLVEEGQVSLPMEELVEEGQVSLPMEELVEEGQVSLPMEELVEEERVPSLMGELSEEEYDYKHPRRGDIRQALVLSVEPHQIVVDVRAKRDGIVPESDLERLREEEISAIEVGDEMAVYVLRPEDNDGNVIVSVNMALVHQDWLRAEEVFKSGEIYEGKVSNCNKGGLVVPLGRISGFVPASQLVNMPRRLSHERKMAKLSEFIDETLPLKVIEVQRRRRRLIFSERLAQREWREQQKQQLMDELYEGEVREGTVSSLCNFGAFVDLGGADGLVHISELAWHRVKHPREVLSVGEKVDVYVLRLDYERGRIGLSIKRLQPDPWTLVDDTYQVGQVVQGKITNVVAFGAFARLEPGVEGLIHISELAEGKTSHPSSVVKKGDELTLRVISVNAGRRRIGLSLRQAPPPEEPAEVEEELEPELVPDGQAIPVEVQETAEEIVVLEDEAEELTEVREELEPALAPDDQLIPEEEAEELAEVREELEPALAPDDQAIPVEVQETVEETVVPEEEAKGLAEVKEELEPEVAPDDQLIPEEMQETAEEIVALEEEAEELAEVREELEPELAPDDQATPAEVQETAEGTVVLEEEAEELAELKEELEPELAPDDQLIPEEVQETAEETVVLEEEAEELAEVREELEPELAPDDQLIPEEVEETAEETAVLEEEAEELAEVKEELEPALAPDDQVIPVEVQETVEETVVPEEEAVETGEETSQDS